MEHNMFLNYFGIIKRIFATSNNSAQSVYDTKAQLFAVKKQVSTRIKHLLDQNIAHQATSFNVSPRQIKSIVKYNHYEPLSIDPSFDNWLNTLIANKLNFYKNLIALQHKFGLSAAAIQTIEAKTQITQQLARNRCSSVFKTRLHAQTNQCNDDLEHEHISSAVKAAIKKLEAQMRSQEKKLLQLEDLMINHTIATPQLLHKHHTYHGQWAN